MSRYDRREAAIRQLLEGTPPVVPPDLYGEALRRGHRMLRRRAAVRRVLWALLCAVVLVCTVWALSARPWDRPPSDTTPSFTTW
ncbi:hypothetical protein GCM10018793_25730 [Streptomyces sulfonofaciens]|uniref:DUF3040 domain-containing protein n=1 Tax=Streptomyces sulfonofaciens TaxID=68272 RepID=A0A919KYQ0_9ACTN|nr:hypothetical protein [Streptomyces sulfonofaciens]GHH77502.1 hypothetical protein GCM10018793_25730 [Streptomyces sulfonofaciens]